MNNKLFNLNWRDILHSLFVAIGSVLTVSTGAVVKYVYDTLVNNNHDLSVLNWKTLLGVAVTGAVGYLWKKFFSDQKGDVLGKI